MWWNGETMTTKLSFACFLGFCLKELWGGKKKISMPGNAIRGLNQGHCQFAAKK
jgi:hypothetical protein